MTLRDSILVAALIGLSCCGCANMSRWHDTFESRTERQDLPLAEWRAGVIESARLIYAGKAETAREVLIDLARAIYAAQQGWELVEVHEDLDTDGDGRIDSSRNRTLPIRPAQPAVTGPQEDSAAEASGRDIDEITNIANEAAFMSEGRYSAETVWKAMDADKNGSVSLFEARAFRVTLFARDDPAPIKGVRKRAGEALNELSEAK